MENPFGEFLQKLSLCLGTALGQKNLSWLKEGDKVIKTRQFIKPEFANLEFSGRHIGEGDSKRFRAHRSINRQQIMIPVCFNQLW